MHAAHRRVRICHARYTETYVGAVSLVLHNIWLTSYSVHVDIITHLGSSITMYVCIYNPGSYHAPAQCKSIPGPGWCVQLNHQDRSIPYCLVYVRVACPCPLDVRRWLRWCQRRRRRHNCTSMAARDAPWTGRRRPTRASPTRSSSSSPSPPLPRVPYGTIGYALYLLLAFPLLRS